MLCRKFDFALFGFLFLVSMIVVLLCPSAWAASDDQFRVQTTSDTAALAAGGHFYDQHKKSGQQSYDEGYAAGLASQ